MMQNLVAVSYRVGVRRNRRYFLNCENKIQFRQLSSSLCCIFIDITAIKSDIEHMKAVVLQQTLMDNQQVILQSLHENRMNIDRLGISIIFSYSQK